MQGNGFKSKPKRDNNGFGYEAVAGQRLVYPIAD
jgi:hypothetical protein